MTIVACDQTTLSYRVNDVPNWGLLVFLGVQVMSAVSAILVAPFQIATMVCAGTATAAIRVQLISATFVACGIATILQCVLGLRLATMTGTSMAFLAPLIALSKSPEFACPYGEDDDVDPAFYLPRLQIMQGSLACAALSIVILGITGLSAIATKYIGPITIAPLLILLELSLVQSCLNQMEQHWVSIIQLLVLVLFAIYLGEVNVPFPAWKDGRFSWSLFRLFGRFPFLLGTAILWPLCLILTATNAVPEGSGARTDNNVSIDALETAPWFYFPYPGQFGPLKFHSGLFIGYLAACLVCTVESLGIYQVAAAASQERPPPSASINRGMMIEGIGCVLAGLMGAGVGVITLTSNIALLSMTRVASRSTLICAGVIMLLLGMFNKFGAVLGTLPTPLIGAQYALSMALVAGVAMSTLQEVNLKQSRNINILGISIVLGMIVPLYISTTPIKTGLKELDSLLNVVLNIQMLVGGVIAFILDNTVPGATLEDRGLARRKGEKDDKLQTITRDYPDGYAFPAFFERFLDRVPSLRRLPIIPSKEGSMKTSQTTIIDQENGDINLSDSEFSPTTKTFLSRLSAKLFKPRKPIIDDLPVERKFSIISTSF